MSEPVLVIMAAGLGSRYGGGGLKQVDPVGPCGERIIDFSMYDAYKAGFRRVVCVIKRDMLEDFKTEIAAPIEKYMRIDYAFQELSDIPGDAEIPEGREKPWGTGHAALCGARLCGDAPYAVINADDFYGREAYEKLYNFLKSADLEGEKLDLCMVGYQVQNTISENGYVSRGVCATEDGGLTQVVERTRIGRTPEGAIGYSEDEGETWVQLDPETPVSMQFWGFTPGFTKALEEEYARFFQEDLPKNPLKGEFYLPFAVNAMLQQGRAKVRVLETGGKWYGVTYRVDRQSVVDALRELTDKGEYPTPLWG
ncbi:nucleotidyltransferase [Acutalibacter muris]|jgi:dTDP-glucose pyrophosphorylase|uniref:Nucleotidyltransferase n=1 Tax=Acutalibacter muris TaxID=1796620 RepID=A0A1Z2XSC1_9FIRM|nr:sugar phosphate nucleotidyltransferase [Acutalibacter muris]ANU55424.1 nucleotidyltransferase [Hungateiclostridiaceae bacterium KB18]ASB41340.1 nucleotidyltransferase [Acutalibacter muris]MCI9544663.1 nucleotidyltransferase [Acutalibacter muris]QQR30605.1 nucleotidyltransferase [Acutalibacter muris]